MLLCGEVVLTVCCNCLKSVLDMAVCRGGDICLGHDSLGLDFIFLLCWGDLILFIGLKSVLSY